MYNKLLLGALICSTPTLTLATNDTIIPFGNGAWVYDGTYSENGKKQAVKAGLFATAISKYNNTATENHRIDQPFAYGGDIEMYCHGSGESEPEAECYPNSFLVTFYPVSMVAKSKNNWEYYLKQLGDSGYTSSEQYKNVALQKNHVIVLDGRVDNGLTQTYDYLDNLNTLDKDDAKHFADKIAFSICADDSVDGVQFDVEPFSFTGKGGTYQGDGQRHFYKQLAKDFAGYHGDNSSDSESGINQSKDASGQYTDPLHCVSNNHPKGRFFSVFTFSDHVTPEVADTFTAHQNGMIVDSLYDLGSKPGGQLNTVAEFRELIKEEIAKMQQLSKTYNLPYQFAIPAAASAHEFASKAGKSTGQKQIDYVKAAIEEIQPDTLRQTDPNFKGIDVWSWNQAMWWGGDQYEPASPEPETLEYLKTNL